MKGLFLDTATQIARHWHCDSEQEEIKKQLEGHNLYCSQYVKAQYKATLLNSIIYLHNLLFHFKDLKRALREARSYINAEIARGKLTFGVQLRIHDVGLWILDYCRSYEEQKRRLEDLVEDVWETQFLEGLKEPLLDETFCAYAKGVPELDESGGYKPIEISCTKNNAPECKIREFWDNHQIQLEILANININSIEAEPKDTNELQKVKEHAGEISHGESPCGRRCTVHLSDAVICIEATHCPKPVAVHSINKKHFRPLGEVLGIESEPKDS